MIVEGLESNEGKGGDTKGQEKPEGAILEDSRMWVEGERWMGESEALVLKETNKSSTLGLALCSRAPLGALTGCGLALPSDAC